MSSKIAVLNSDARSLVTFRGELLQAMAAQGHAVLALAPDDDPNAPRELEALGIPFAPVFLDRTGANPLREALTMISLVRVFWAHRPQVLLACTVKPIIYGLIAAQLTGILFRAALVTGLGSAFNVEGNWRRRALRYLVCLLYRLALRSANIVFFENQDDETTFKRLRLVRGGQKTYPIYGGVNLDRFPPTPLPPMNQLTFLMVSRIIRDKGVIEYIEAARLVRTVHPNVKFQLLGGFDSNPSALSRADFNSVLAGSGVEYLGETSDVRPFIARAHVVVLPSYGEGVSRSVLEGMAMSRAVVTTDAPGCRETVRPGVNGLLVEPRSARSLASGIERLLAQADKLPEMGRASRAYVEERFNVHDMNRTILSQMGLA